MLVKIDNPSTGWLAAVLGLLPFPLDWNEGPWVAGGAPRRFLANDAGLNGADVDVFFKSEAQYHAAVRAVEELFPLREIEFDDGTRCDLFTPWSVFYTLPGGIPLKLNLVHREWYESAEAVVEQFDFTHCQFITDGKVIGHAPKALDAAKEKRLVFRKTDSVPATLRRALKYAAQGFTASDDDIGAFLAAHADLENNALFHVRDSSS